MFRVTLVNQVLRGTVQHEVLEGVNIVSAYQDGEMLRIRVTCKKDATVRLDEVIPYGLAVTLEVKEDIEIPIYQQIRAKLKPQIAVGAGQRYDHGPMKRTVSLIRDAASPDQRCRAAAVSSPTPRAWSGRHRARNGGQRSPPLVGPLGKTPRPNTQHFSYKAHPMSCDAG